MSFNIQYYSIYFIGGIPAFGSDEDVVMKWCLNRPQQSKNTAVLKRMANLSNGQSIYKQLRPSNIPYPY